MGGMDAARVTTTAAQKEIVGTGASRALGAGDLPDRPLSAAWPQTDGPMGDASAKRC
jgi:hypothetical protein